MYGSLTSFDNLFDQFFRGDRDLEDLTARWGAPASIRAVARGTFPPINVGATESEVNVYLFAAGLDPKKLDVSVQQNLLMVTGERQLPINENAVYFRQERFGGEFRRVVTLPDDVNPDSVEAKYREGVVHVRMQRREAAKPRQVEIKSS